jgi:hypothetical protein
VEPFASAEEYREFRPPPPWVEPVMLPEDFRTLPPSFPAVEPAYPALIAPASWHDMPEAYREFEAFTGSASGVVPPAAHHGPDPVPAPVSWYDTAEPPPGFEEFTAPDPRYDRPDGGLFDSFERSFDHTFGESSFGESSFGESLEESSFGESFAASIGPSTPVTGPIGLPIQPIEADRYTPLPPPPWQDAREETGTHPDRGDAGEETGYQPLAWEPGTDPVADGAWSTAPNLPPGVIDLQGRSVTAQPRDQG